MTMLKKYRLDNRYTQKDMANKLELNLNTYRNYELGKRCMPYSVLAKFLVLRGNKDDRKLAKILQELC